MLPPVTLFNIYIININIGDDNIKRKYLKAHEDLSKYLKEYTEIITNNHLLINQKVAHLALFMSKTFPKLPYFWGGGHHNTPEELKGFDHEWGTLKPIIDSGNTKYPVGKLFPKSLDCSGFVTWCLVNCGFSLNQYVSSQSSYALNSQEFTQLGPTFNLLDPHLLKIIKPGDLAIKKGHIGIITNVSKSKQTIKIAHLSSAVQGLNLTTISLNNGHVIKDELGPLLTNNPPNRLNKKYFTKIISVNY